MYSIFSVAESVGSNSTTPRSSPYFIPAAIAFFTSSFSFLSFFNRLAPKYEDVEVLILPLKVTTNNVLSKHSRLSFDFGITKCNYDGRRPS